jgi:YHS domain-containing protein
MKNVLLLAGAAVMLAPAAFAGPGKKAPAKTPVTPAKLECPVMAGHPVDVKDATAKKMYADYKGNRYFFCCAGCPPQFKADPAKFAKGQHIATPKAAKKG